MAERIVRQLIDDIDGTDITDDGGEQLEFSVRGVTYRLDLSSANAAKFDKVLKPYIDAAEKVSGADSARTNPSRRPKKSTRGSSGSSEQLAAIRAWARKKGYEVSDRGRIKSDIVEAFNAAH